MSVNQVNIGALLQDRDAQNVELGLDIGKDVILGMLRWEEGDLEKPWKIKNPSEIGELVSLAKTLSQGRRLRIGMEPTGTYGDPLRQGLADAGLTVHRVSTKASHDYAEIYDNVPSQHDGKDAAVVALGKSRVWPFESGNACKEEMKYWVRHMERWMRSLQWSASELEGELMRHWPELGHELKLTSATLLRIVQHYGDPQRLGQDAQAAERIHRWSFGSLSAERIAKLVSQSKQSRGVRVGGWSRRQLQEGAERGWQARQQVRRAQKELTRLAQTQEWLQAQAAVVGGPTACVLYVYLGDPRNYDNAHAYRKAMGLNLVERSSGRYEGQLKISKRGQPAVRRWLYFSALRWSRKEPVKRWFASKKEGRGKGRGTLAAVAVMRKLALPLYEVAVKGGPFDAGRLFESKPPAPREGGGRRRRRASRRRDRKEIEKGEATFESRASEEK